MHQLATSNHEQEPARHITEETSLAWTLCDGAELQIVHTGNSPRFELQRPDGSLPLRDRELFEDRIRCATAQRRAAVGRCANTAMTGMTQLLRRLARLVPFVARTAAAAARKPMASA